MRWALGIRPGGKWLEYKLEHSQPNGFRLQAWNRLPRAEPTIKLAARDVGLPSDADVLQVQLNEPAFRQAAEFDVTWKANKISLQVSKAAKIRLFYRKLQRDWPGQDKSVLERRRPQGGTEAVPDVIWENDSVEWQALPGQYELRPILK